MRRRQRMILWLAMLFLAVALLPGCGARRKTETIKIGSVHPLTGSMAYEGQAIVNAQRIAIDRINEQGGVNGRMLELLPRDSMGTSSGAANATLKLANSGVVALTGTYNSSAAQVVSRMAEKTRIPFVVTVAASDNLLSNGYHYSFRIQPSTSRFSRNFLDFFDFFRAEDIETVAFIYENSNYGSGIVDYIQAHIDETNLRVVGVLSYAATTSTLSSEVTKLASLNPDLVISVGYYSDQSLLIKEILERDIHFKKIIGVANGAFSDAKFTRTYGTAVDGIYDINYRYNPNSEEAQELLDTYLERYGEEMPAHAIYGYQSIMVIADALRRCSDVNDTEALRDAIAASEIYDHVLPQGVIRFDEKGENVNAAGVMVEIVDGKHVIVFPEEYANYEEVSE